MITSSISTVLGIYARTPDWSPTVGVIISASVLVAVLLGRAVIKYPNVGPKVPALSDITGLSLPALLATASFGHIIGTGITLGLTNAGII